MASFGRQPSYGYKRRQANASNDNYWGLQRYYNNYNRSIYRYNRNFYQGKRLERKVSQLANLINVEFKYNDIKDTSTINTTGLFFLLNGLMLGDTSSSRDGRQIRIKSNQVNLKLTMHPSATNTTIRIIYFMDKQANASAPTTAMLLEDANVPITSPRNLDNRKRFVILKDEYVCLNVEKSETVFEWYKKLDFRTIYDSSNVGDITDITTNSFYLFLVCDDGTNTPTYALYNRIRFIDN